MAETDMYNKQMSLFDEGGMADDGMDVDPVSGNEVPPGSMSEEVRDDVDAKLSSGEYVVPADVVQYFGLKFFENLRSEAKGDLEKMDKDGRIGGAPNEEASMGGEELSPEEMAMLEEIMAGGGQEAPVQMAEGGLTPGYNPSPSTFNPKDWSTVGTSTFTGSAPKTETKSMYRSYTGPNGEVRLIAFVDGKPTTPIPKGFVPKGTPAEELEKTPEEIEAEELQAMELANRGPAEEGDTDPEADWGSDNYDAISEDPVAFGMDLLGESSSSLAGTVAGALGGVPGAIAGAVMGAQEAGNLAGARAAESIASAQGKDTTDLQGAISEYAENMGIVGKGIDRAGFASGKGKAESYSQAQASRSVEKSSTTTPTVATTTKSDPTPTATPSVTPSSTPDDDDSAGSTGGSRSGGLGGGEMNKGGLVKKRTTKKTTKKTQPKKKGLASK